MFVLYQFPFQAGFYLLASVYLENEVTTPNSSSNEGTVHVAGIFLRHFILDSISVSHTHTHLHNIYFARRIGKKTLFLTHICIIFIFQDLMWRKLSVSQSLTHSYKIPSRTQVNCHHSLLGLHRYIKQPCASTAQVNEIEIQNSINQKS